MIASERESVLSFNLISCLECLRVTCLSILSVIIVCVYARREQVS